MSRKRPEPEPEPESKHGTTAESMISWRCRCGEPWYNEKLRNADGTQKTDEQLVIEKDEAFLNHVREMEHRGYA